MQWLRCSCVLLATLAFAGDADISGTWKVDFTVARDQRPKVPVDFVFDLKSDAGKLTGMAHMRGWPGDAPITNGTVEGSRVRFTVIGKLPFSAGRPGAMESGYPKMTFTGTVHDREIQLTLQWDSIMTTGEERRGQAWDLHGKRTE